MLVRDEYMRNLELAEYVLKNYDGNYSCLYRILKKEIDAMQLPLENIAFANEFICFEDAYARIRKHMHLIGIDNQPVIDIGCQLGFQSAMFEDCGYIGIDSFEKIFFNDQGNYIHGTFPTQVHIGLAGKIVISNMSLGYFNDEDHGITNESICKALKEAKYLYISAPTELIYQLKTHFNKFEYFKLGQYPQCAMMK